MEKLSSAMEYWMLCSSWYKNISIRFRQINPTLTGKLYSMGLFHWRIFLVKFVVDREIIHWICSSRRLQEENKSKGFDDLGKVKWELAVSLLVIFILVYFALWKGIKSSGKVRLSSPIGESSRICFFSLGCLDNGYSAICNFIYSINSRCYSDRCFNWCQVLSYNWSAIIKEYWCRKSFENQKKKTRFFF